MFGVIIRDNLSQGIVERRQDGTLVVYRKFRRNPNTLTPFGMYFSRDLMRVSDSDLMVINKDEFEELLGACCGIPAKNVKIMARPLMEKDRQEVLESQEEIIPLHVEILCPVVLTVPPPPQIRSEESLI